MALLLEYNEKDHQFHHNYYNPQELGFGDKLFTNGWKPVCVLGSHYAHEEHFRRFTDKLSEDGSSYERVCEKVLELVAAWNHSLEDLGLD